MAKRSHRSLSKKMLPFGAIRCSRPDGQRVWLFNKIEYATMRDLIFNRPIQRLTEVQPTEGE